MLSSGWQKQNYFIRNAGFAISIVISGLLGLILVSLGFKLGAMITIFLAILGFIVTFLLSTRKPKSLICILRFDYKEIERDFRILFKEKHIRFIKRTEDDAYSYEFPGHSLRMTVQPYTIHNYNFVLDRQLTKQPTTEVTLGELNEKNEEFAEMLAESIGEMAKKRANNQDKS